MKTLYAGGIASDFAQADKVLLLLSDEALRLVSYDYDFFLIIFVIIITIFLCGGLLPQKPLAAWGKNTNPPRRTHRI